MLNDPKDDELEKDIIDEDIIDDEDIIIDEDEEDSNDDVSEKEDDDEDDDDNYIDNTINYDESESDLDVYFKYNTNNHKLDGKHSLKRDTILNGKPNESTEKNDLYLTLGINQMEYYEIGDVLLEKGSMFEEESRKGEELLNKRRLAEDVYNLLRENTELDFGANRRKPNKIVFNNYYRMLLINMDKKYSKSEIFVELAYYFTDNIFNMFKLLDKKYATNIIWELKEKGHLNNLDFINFK